METSHIKKRDGSVVEFEKEKILIAMQKAATSTQSVINQRMFDVMTDHVVRHIQLKFKEKIPDVESVQDFVEQTLMEWTIRRCKGIHSVPC